ncbi:MAG: isopentenyl-diphosphate Delta-isomerase [Crocinitomicaceae bacterium]|nr:isopentenyl-diphosphate Delta-isomerase [Crocinitomicaceae bacterium]
MLEDLVVLVNEQDEEIGTMPKLEAHQKGLLHRAFSVLIYNSKKEMLIHQRAMGKYHSEGLWTNACCSHPKPEETVVEAAHRRLQEELGFDCELNNEFDFIYKTPLENQLFEHEYDHVFSGIYDGHFEPNPEEIMDYRWVSIADLKQEISLKPADFTFWFKLIMEKC